MSLRIPARPAQLSLAITRLWNGARCEDARLQGRLALAATPEGLHLCGSLPDPAPAQVPDAPSGSRVADLWHYDVVEAFLLGSGGRYLEVELGAGGHFLVLSFRAPRERSDAHEGFAPRVEHRAGAQGWQTALVVPWRLVPRGLCALGAFVSARGCHLSSAPLPGDVPDFHQPAAWPAAQLAPEAAALRPTDPAGRPR